MKFVKENLTLVICGAAALLAIVFAWYASGPMRSGLYDQIRDRMGVIPTIKQLANTRVDLPGNPVQTGPPPEKWSKAKKDLIESINAQKGQVEKESKTFNSRGRITSGGVPILPLLPNGKPEPDFLPKTAGQAAAHQFKDDYGLQFKLWMNQLAFGGDVKPAELDVAMPPNEQRLDQEFQAMQDQKKASMGAALGGAVMGGSDTKEKMLYKQNKVLAKARELRMYVDPAAFQIRPWLVSDVAPNEQQIFEAMVDSWLQADVVRAIDATNRQVAGPTAKNIAKSPIKRLIHITIGNSARTRSGQAQGPAVSTSSQSEIGDLFYTVSAAQGQMGQPLVNPNGAQPGQPAEPNKINFDMGMTGHTSGGEYDVVQMLIWVDIDPAYVNAFMDQLYRQNMGYTWVSTHARTADPIDRVGFGFMYGDTQVLEAQFQVEAILFRSWTAPLMPAPVRAALGVPEPAPGK